MQNLPNDQFNILAEDITDRALRPNSFQSFIGQKDLIQRLQIAIDAAKARDEPIPSTLICSPPGYGKTTIGKIIASEYGTDCKLIMGPSIKSPGDLIEILMKVEENSCLFIDEIHALNPKTEETLYSAIEDFQISRKISSKEILHIDINPFALIGATTQPWLISKPLQDRFGIVHNLTPYSDDELAIIIKNNLSKIDVTCSDDEVLKDIAKRSRGTPRLANRLLYRIRDYVQLNNDGCIDQKSVDEVMVLEGIDKEGLTKLDRSYLVTLYKNFQGGPAGINAIASSINQPKEVLEQGVENLLCHKGFIIRTKSGRALTDAGLNHIKEYKYEK